MKVTNGLGTVAVLALLASCGSGELILDGVRQDPRNAVIGGAPEDVVSLAPVEGAASPIALPAARANADWTQRAGNAAHNAGNVALAAPPAPLWSVSIGAGNSRKNRTTADPVVAGGRIFAMDAEAGVAAVSTAGAVLWRRDLTPASDRKGDASGGGLAYGEGRVYATTGFGDLVALDPDTGNEIWRQRFDAAPGGAPAVSDGRVFVALRDGSAWAIRASDGKVEWTLPGAGNGTGVEGASAPAADARQAVFPLASGQVVAVEKVTGTGLWGGYVAGQRRGRAFATITDLTGDPVIADGRVYAASSAGTLGAFDADTGQTLWTTREGATGPVVVAGGAVFFVNDEDQLLRVDAGTGALTWRNDLPYYTKDRTKRRRNIYAHFGPVLAGGRLLTASSDGLVRLFDPASGALAASVEIGDAAAAAPAIAGGTLYVVTQDGKLRAFR